MIDCPNCGTQADESAALCPNCGFDLHSQVADDVRHLREEGKIHPGRLGASDPEDFAGGEPSETPGFHTDVPSEDLAFEDPEQLDRELGP